jgi:hypothetical protein
MLMLRLSCHAKCLHIKSDASHKFRLGLRAHEVIAIFIYINAIEDGSVDAP